MHRSLWLATLLAVTAPAVLLAQARKPAGRPVVQQVIPPKTVYWASAATTTGIAMGGRAYSTGDMMRMAMGGGMDKVQKDLKLDLGSKVPPSGPPAASHAIPPGMNMGQALPLKTPKIVSKPTEQAPPEDFERPKGKLLLFWGCGDTARPGQPVVIDFEKLAAGQIPPGLFGGERVRIARPPSVSTWPTYGGWPNEDRSGKQSVPAGASLLGDHKVSGNYSPPIDFTLTQDWMGSLDMKQAKSASGALALSWNGVPGATAHFAQMFGAGQVEGGGGKKVESATIVFWSSSEVQTFMSGLSDFVAPAEAQRLVGTKQLLPSTQHNCTIPKEAMAAAPMGFITLVAHGPEQNFVYPPRPADPKTPWVQDWTVKARFASRTGGIAGMDMSEMGAMGGSSSSKGGNGKPPCQPSSGEMAGGAVGGAIGSALGGMFGGKKKKDCQ